MEDGMFKLWVKDTGVGIPRSDMPLIFKKFHRAANIDRNSEGAGVGLALSQELVKLHKGGAIHVESEPGRGR
jgi:signal transduction histidine kinase